MLIYLKLKLKIIVKNIMTTTLNKKDINIPLVPNKPEVELLLCCARSQVDAQTKVKIKNLVDQDLDWELLLKLANKHKLLPLLSHGINLAGCQSISSDIYAILNTASQANTQRNLSLTAELLRILNILKKAQISAIPLKGPVLAAFSYGNFGLRSTSDLDIIIELDNFVNVHNLLLQNGYKECTDNDLNHKRQASYYNLKTLIAIDLHYDFAPKNSFVAVESAGFWQNLQPILIAGQQINILSTENLILYLCLEGSKEYWRKLQRLCDLASSIQNHDVNWELLVKQASDVGKPKVFFLGMFLAKKILNISIPDEIWELVENNLSIKPSATQINQFLFNQEFNWKLALEWHLFNIQTFPSISEKIKYCWQVIQVNYKTRTKKWR